MSDNRAMAPAKRSSSNSDSESDGKSVECRKCERRNSPARRFCAGCGQSLWETCPHCQAECAADEKFCGACGTDIVTYLQDLQRQRKECMEKALSLSSMHDYQAAIAALRPLARDSGATSEPFRSQARQLIERFRSDERKLIEASAAALATARTRVAACDYGAAARIIEGVPPSMRAAEHTLLLDRARQAESELRELLAEIRTSIQKKQTSDLLPKLDRVLALQPGHDEARTLARSLCQRALRSAEHRLAEFRYAEAIDRLEQIPLALRDEAFSALYDAAAERQALRSAIEGASMADATLLDLAKRLYSLVPDDPAAKRLRDKALAFTGQRGANPRSVVASGRLPQERATQAATVEWLTSFKRTYASGAVADQVERYSGRLFVALGLALQGLGLAAVPIDLMPKDRSPVWRRVSGLSFRLRPTTSAWGIDLGEFALKAIKLQRGQGGNVIVEACEFLHHDQPLVHLSNPAERAAVVKQTVHEFAARAGELQAVKVGINVPGQRVLGRFFALPPMPIKKTGQAVALEARRLFPMALDDLCWSFHAFDMQDPVAQLQVLVQAAQEVQVRDRLMMFQAGGVPIDFVQSDCVALHNAVMYELYNAQAGEMERDECVATIDVGTRFTNVVLSAANGLWFRTIGVGGQHVTDALGEQFQLSSQEAESLKQNPATKESFHRWQSAVARPLTQLTDEIKRSFRSYSTVYDDRKPGRVHALGGGAQTVGLLSKLLSSLDAD